jgi:long-chain acyl-CoA synthetase
MAAKTATAIVAETWPKTFVANAEARGKAVAMREKELGIWQAVTWDDLLERVKEVAYGLMKLGFEPGEVTSVLSNNNPEWYYADIGTQCAGGICSGIYPTDSAKQVEYLCNDSKTTYLFVEDDEQLDKWLQVRDRTPDMRMVIIFDLEGLRDFHDDMVISMDRLRAIGREYMHERPELWQERLESRQPGDCAVLVYTSGTTGPPKGAMLSHRNVCFQMEHQHELLPQFPGDERLSFLPVCHVAERIISGYASMCTGAIMNFVESPETVPENVREVQPNTFGAVPRVWEKFYSGILIRLADSTALQKAAYNWAIGIGYKIAERKLNGEPIPASLRALFWIGKQIALRNVRKMIGIDHCRWLVTGAAPIAPDLIKWYLALGFDMLELYGQTECCGIATCMLPDHIKLGTVGKPVSYAEVKIDENGEILIRGEHVFMGYLNQPEKTAETIDSEGWLHSGDVGYIDNEGFVKITDRMKDIIITAGGKNITPSEIENQLKFSPYISDAVIIGDQRKFLSCLIMIDQENVEKYAQDHDVPFSNYASLCRAPQVQKLIEQEIEKVNQQFAQVEQVKAFRLIEQQLTAEDEELTATMKLKRGFVEKKYASLIDSMYGGA